jgi:formylglycine-generating enzyme required for sulfatase activity
MNRRRLMEFQSIAFALLWLLLVCPVTRAVTIDMVTVGNAGNAADTRYNPTGFGSVGYAYQIGKYEVTAGQYTEFLNAVADADPNGLYNTLMGDPGAFGANIQRTGSSPNFSYNVAGDWADRPVNYVSFWGAARFANWLHNGQPTGPQGPGTTEDGAYLNVDNQNSFARQPGARFFIPTEDEWYKAAYHDKTAGLAATYFDYPTGTNAMPGNDISEATNSGNNANYYINDYAIGSPYYLTVAGEFELSDSPYGTFDQGGNVFEWNEALNTDYRGLRGGWFTYDFFDSLLASYSYGYLASLEDGAVGFRVARSAVPEPNSLVIFTLGGAGAFLVCGGISRRRSRCLSQ